ncbi:hypothetical protein B296_00029014 [Ensete ventricosum]|uniref:Uncharacterized protein n=1 Tax=Ensete ventricosum TaxID=4639 RepID=A0A427AER8_ENSVE|nr:hypothetical protein B296_00029014 [Ensete ventricosum]
MGDWTRWVEVVSALHVCGGQTGTRNTHLSLLACDLCVTSDVCAKGRCMRQVWFPRCTSTHLYGHRRILPFNTGF